MISTTTAEVICTAMETMPTRDVLDWGKRKLGKTLQRKKKLLRVSIGLEQMREESEAAFST